MGGGEGEKNICLACPAPAMPPAGEMGTEKDIERNMLKRFLIRIPAFG